MQACRRIMRLAPPSSECICRLAEEEPDDGDVDDAEQADDAAEVGWEEFEASPAEAAPEAPDRFLIGESTPTLTGADLAAWRARHGLTQQVAADRLGVRQGTVSKAESRGAGALGPALRQGPHGMASAYTDHAHLLAALADARAAGIDLAATASELQEQGAKAFVQSWHALLADLRAKGGALPAR